MSKTLARVVHGAGLALAAALLLSTSVFAANDWVNFGTVSMTDATHPKLTNGYGCYTDGKDILCDSATSGITFGTGGLIDMGGLTVAGSVSAAAVSATYVSGTVIQVNASTMPCSTGLNGAIRYSSTNNSLEVCIGTTWSALSSNTTPGNANVAGANTNIQYNNNGALGGDSNLTYVSATGTVSASGAYYSGDSNAYFYNNLTTPVLVFDANDYLRYTRASNVYDFLIGGNPMVTINGSGNLLVNNLVSATLFYGANGTVGAPTYSFANDTNSGFYRPASNIIGVSIGSAEVARFTAGGISTTGTVNAAQVSSTYTSSSLVQVGGGAGAGCVAGLNGAIRYNSTSNTIDVCVGTAWTSLNSGTITGSGISGGSATAIAFWNGPSSLTYESTTTSGLYWDHPNGRLGIGTNAPQVPLQVSNTGYLQEWSLGDVLNSGVTLWGAATSGYPGPRVSFLTSGTAFEVFDQDAVASRFFITSTTGYVGVGTQSPGANLQVSGTFLVSTTGQNSAASASFLVDTRGVSVSSIVHINGSAFSPIGAGGNVILSGTTAVSTSSAGSITLAAGGSSRIAVDGASGFVGVGTLTPTQPLTVNGIVQTGTTGNNGQINFGGSTEYVGSNYGAHIVAIGTNSAERMRIDSGGYVGIGTTNTGSQSPNPGVTFGPTGWIGIGNNAQASGWWFQVFSRSGVGIGVISQNGTTGVTYNTSSDRRVKENITDTREGLQKLMQIGVKDFQFRADPSHTIVNGFIAQDLNKVYPEAVTTNGDDGEVPLTDQMKVWSVDYGRITPLIVKAVQDLKHLFDAHDEEIEKLKADNDNLHRELDEMRGDIRAMKAGR